VSFCDLEKSHCITGVMSGWKTHISFIGLEKLRSATTLSQNIVPGTLTDSTRYSSVGSKSSWWLPFFYFLAVQFWFLNTGRRTCTFNGSYLVQIPQVLAWLTLSGLPASRVGILYIQLLTELLIHLAGVTMLCCHIFGYIHNLSIFIRKQQYYLF